MAGAVLPVLLCLCQLTVTITHMSNNSNDVSAIDTSLDDVRGVRTVPEWPCGDNLCLCTEHHANCSGHPGQVTYVPKLPDEITNVDLSGNSFSSEALTSDLFANLTNVTTLQLSHSNIAWLPRSVFQGMNKLRNLALNGNEALKPASLREVFSIPTLKDVSVINCALPPLEADLFKNISSHVDVLRLDSNPHGGTYNFEGLCAVQYLWHLYLPDCDFKEIASTCQLKVLSYLDLSGNAFRRFPKACIGKGTSMFPNLSDLNLQHNHIEVLSTDDICLPSLIRLDMSYNFILSYPTGTFSSLKFPFLDILILHHQSRYWDMFVVSTKIEDHAFDNPDLKRLDLGDNELWFADIAAIGKNAFANCHKLQDLYVNANNFTYVNDQRFLELFGHLKLLKNFLIFNSKLEILSTETFANFPYLMTLFLDDNVIASIPDGAFDSLQELQRLSLDNNKINTISERTFCTELRNSLSSVTLSFNPFICSCELLWFQQWFLTEDSKFVQPRSPVNDYRCHNIPGMTLANFSMTEQACLLSREVHLFIIQGSSVSIIILVITSLVFRYRWHLRLLMYEVFRGRGNLRRQRLLVNNFDYDVFVSYASNDLPWVRKQLMAKLEDELGLRLCVHERDFVPGEHIVDNIVQCVDSSKKILMVFSQHFVHSQWCQFELALCLSHVMDYDDALIVACVDDVTSRQMTASMMAVLRTTTYIQWGEEEDAMGSFWGRLSLALNEILPRGENYV